MIVTITSKKYITGHAQLLSLPKGPGYETIITGASEY